MSVLLTGRRADGGTGNENPKEPCCDKGQHEHFPNVAIFRDLIIMYPANNTVDIKKRRYKRIIPSRLLFILFFFFTLDAGRCTAQDLITPHVAAI